MGSTVSHQWTDGNPEPSPHFQERRELVQRIVRSRHFARAPLLSRFLIHVCDKAFDGRQAEITEHQIGVQVFGRAAGYNPGEDNIVRNYARQLRKRLAEYFAEAGEQERYRIEIPRGGYLPVFLLQPPQGAAPGEISLRPVMAPPRGEIVNNAFPARLRPWRWLAFLLYSIALAAAVYYGGARLHRGEQPSGVSHALWAELFNPGHDTFVVPADSGFGILQNLARTRMPLADYVNGRYVDLPLPSMDPHDALDLHTQRYTSVVDLEVASTLSRLPEAVPGRLILRFARDLRMDDLKQGNAILIGSMYSNPWAEVFQRSLNFRFDYRPQVNDSWIVNENPRPGENKSYENEWDGPSHQTYAVIAFVPNLNNSGHVLLIQGLDMAGTQAAAELLFRKDEIGPLLKEALQPNGKLGSFEILLQTTSIGSNSPRARILATRFYSH